MNEVIYNGHINGTDITYTFSDADGTLMQGATAYRALSPLGDQLEGAQYKIPVIFRPRDYSVEPEAFMASARRGDYVYLREGGAVVGRFNLTEITGGEKLQDGQYAFNLVGTDLAGLLAGRIHKGGVYANAKAGDIIKDIMGANFVLTEQSMRLKWYIGFVGVYSTIDVFDTRVDGWLPYGNARDNMRTLMQIIGARLSWITGSNLFANATLDLITQEYPGAPTPVSPYEIYSGDRYGQGEKVSTCVVNEHSYLQLPGTEAETIYEADGAVNELVVFDRPYYDLAPQSIIVESGANYAIVTGTGTLTGKPYTDNVRKLSGSVPDVTGGGTKTVDNTLAGPLVSSAMLARMQDYYAGAKIIENAVSVPDLIEAGSLLQLEDPLGNVVNAYVREQTMTFSGITQSSGQLVTGWTPSLGPVYTEKVVLDQDGTITVPPGAVRMKLIVIQGGKGGWGGYPGQSAQRPSPDAGPTVDGEGGAVGEGGDAGKIFVIDVVQDDLAASYTATVGVAGTPGGIDHGEGAEGGHSTVTDGEHTYSSADGAVQSSGLVDPIDSSIIYGVPGRPGIYPGQPGAGGSITDTETGVAGNTTWNTGANSSYGNGGGAAYGSDGGNAGRAEGSGGDGADAALDGFNGYIVTPGTYGSGGIGGNGAGGGGAHVTSAGSGGHGSVGGPAAGGAVIALFAFGDTPAPVPTPGWLFDADGEPLYDYYYERLAAQED